MKTKQFFKELYSEEQRTHLLQRLQESYGITFDSKEKIPPDEYYKDTGVIHVFITQEQYDQLSDSDKRDWRSTL